MGQVAGLPPQTLINRGRRVARKRLGVRCVRTWSGAVPRREVAFLLVTFPVAFAVHEAEEVPGARTFTGEARGDLAKRLLAIGAPEGGVGQFATRRSCT
jgi:hypothetical protein